jgi:hypothetical protein
VLVKRLVLQDRRFEWMKVAPAKLSHTLIISKIQKKHQMGQKKVKP